jgi:alpha-glucosidase
MIRRKFFLKSSILTVCIFSACFFSCNPPKSTHTNSPDGKIKISLNTESGIKKNQLTYDVWFSDIQILKDSPLGFEFAGGMTLQKDFRITDVVDSVLKDEYSMPFGKSSRISSISHQKTILLEDRSGLKLHVIFRVFDDGVGIRYYLPDQMQYENIEIIKENTGFYFTNNFEYYGLHLNTYTSAYEAEYTNSYLNDIPGNALIGLPMLIKVSPDIWVAITEAALLDYAGMYLQPEEENTTSLTSMLSPRKDGSGICVKTQGGRYTPWRVLFLGENPGDLVESNLVLNFNDPPDMDFSWVKPGLALDDWTCDQTVKGTGWEGAMDTRTMKHFIDFCADYGLDYMSIDAGWYGADWSDTTLDLTTPIPEIDIPYLVKYANDRDVDVFLWTLSNLLIKQIDEVIPLFREWGVKGFNVDFFDRDDQETVNKVNSIVRQAAENQFMVEFHGIYKPTGISRTYPNLLAHEAVLGLEYYKWDSTPTPEHNCIIPFTRMLAGPMDYIVVGFTNRTPEQYEIVWDEFNSLGTRCHHLAQLVIFETGFQVFGDYPDNYRNSFGADLFPKVTVSWDETKVINARVGDFVSIARRKDKEWFIGTITDWDSRKLKVPLTFLKDGKYSVEMYSDTENSNIDPRDGKYEAFQISEKDTLEIYLASGGGNVLRIYPADNGE